MAGTPLNNLHFALALPEAIIINTGAKIFYELE